MLSNPTLSRCSWCNQDQVYLNYHDQEWGKLNLKESYLFEMLILEGQQAGLSWITVLKKRENYRKLIDKFDYFKIAYYLDKKVYSLLQEKGIIRNRLKIKALVINAQRFIQVQKEFKSFKKYLLTFTQNKIYQSKKFLVENKLSIKIAKDLQKRGFKFVGSKIIYAYLEAIGVMNNHEPKCFLYKKIRKPLKLI